MNQLDVPHASPAVDHGPPGGEIVAVAHATTVRADHDDASGELVIVARTSNGGLQAIGSDGSGPLRAAVSVAVAAGNQRLWEGANGAETVERPIRTLPEIIRTTADAAGVHVAHVGCVEDESVAAVAVWFEVDDQVCGAAGRRETMELLIAAAERQREHFAAVAEAEAEAAAATADQGDADDGVRRFDPNDPHLDMITGLATRAEFERAMEGYESDEATLVVVDLDHFAEVPDKYSESVADVILLEIADRLVGSCRGEDLIARVGVDTFAILFADAPRSVGLHVAKRLLDTIALPLDVDGGPDAVTATVALAHQFGLVDMDELMESADDAVASGKRSGAGRLVVAS